MSDSYKAKDHYQQSQIATEYDEERFTSWSGKVAHQIESQALAYAADKYFQARASILDIPCGTGRLFPILLEKGYQITGVDISNEMIVQAKKKFPKIEFHLADAEKLPFRDNQFDYVTSYRLMCHLPEEVRNKVLHEMLRIAKKSVVINYHFSSLAPLAIFNQLFRKTCAPSFACSERKLKQELTKSPYRLLEIKKLSWFERSSSLVIIQKS